MRSIENINRNEELDIFRGLTMIWVIFIHCLFWIGLGSYDIGKIPIIKSLFLIEMPMFFFLSGACNSISRKKSLINFYVTRLQRIIIPYWIYSAICIFLTYIVVLSSNLQVDSSKLIFSWLIPLNKQDTMINYLTWALWFIPVYILVILTFPFLKKYFDRINNLTFKIVPLIILALLVYILDKYSGAGNFYYFLRHVVFYCFWMYLGLFYKNITNIKRKYKIISICFIFICAAMAVILNKNYNYSPNMQTNKFPPNFIFLVYTFGALNIVYLFKNYIIKLIKFLRKNSIINWIFQSYIDYVYTIFLFQPFSFIAFKIIINYSRLNILANKYQLLSFIICLIITIPLNALGKMFHWCEDIKIIKLRDK